MRVPSGRAVGAAVCVALAWAVGAADASALPRFAATYLPKGHELVTGVSDGDGYHVVRYRRGLSVWTHAEECCGVAMTEGRRIEVRGHRARLARYIDERWPYGRVIVWEEHPDVWIEVGFTHEHGVSETQLRKVAEKVHRVSRAQWRHWRIETQPYPSEEQMRKMERAVVRKGIAHGREWRLRALIPPGYPFDDNDLRRPCAEVSYSGGSYPTCNGAAWYRLEGQIFVFGVIRSGVRHVRISDYGAGAKGGVVVATASPDRVRKYSFYAAAMPSDTCTVEITDADTGDFLEYAGPQHDLEGQECEPSDGARRH